MEVKAFSCSRSGQCVLLAASSTMYEVEILKHRSYNLFLDLVNDFPSLSLSAAFIDYLETKERRSRPMHRFIKTCLCSM